MKVRIKQERIVAGVYFAPGDEPTLPDYQAERLIEAGAAERVQTRAQRIEAAVESVEFDGYKPSTSALSAYLGFRVSAAERDQALDAIKTRST